jgi:peptide deformylase
MILPLVYYGNPLLRKKSKKITKITEDIKKLILDMTETMDAKKGVGLAAIQVGVPVRLLIIRPVTENKDGEVFLGEIEVYINPVISNHSDETETLPEGCLSVPGLHMDVERPKMIHIEASDVNGNKISKDVSGFKARELMHENDHLNGVLFIDRLATDKKKLILSSSCGIPNLIKSLNNCVHIWPFARVWLKHGKN